MHCPFCGHTDTQVIETRMSEEGDSIRRRRRCPSCDKRFTTYERIELPFPAVVKKDGSRVEFDRAKLRGSLMLALRKRPVAVEDLDRAVNAIEEQLLNLAVREVSTEQVGELVMTELQKLDQVAYVRFASVYRSFKDVEEFTQMVQDLQNTARKPGRKRATAKGEQPKLF